MKFLDSLRTHTRRSGGSPDVAGLAGHSQAELTDIEAHERAHEGRPEILHKLRYLRGSEPLPGYDGLEADDIARAVDGADRDTLDRVREYERKFRRRDEVLDAVSRARHRGRAEPS